MARSFGRLRTNKLAATKAIRQCYVPQISCKSCDPRGRGKPRPYNVLRAANFGELFLGRDTSVLSQKFGASEKASFVVYIVCFQRRKLDTYAGNL
jgi:hypothetical protein